MTIVSLRNILGCDQREEGKKTREKNQAQKDVEEQSDARANGEAVTTTK